MDKKSRVTATLIAEYFTYQFGIVKDFEMTGSYPTLLEAIKDWGFISNPGHQYELFEYEEGSTRCAGEIKVFRTYAELRDYITCKVSLSKEADDAI